MNFPQDKIVLKGRKYQLTWIRTDSLKGYFPITQVYGVCFDKYGNILIARSKPDDSRWQISGGTPEEGESTEQTLKRELLEEVDIEVEDIRILGVQKVEELGELIKTYYQVRCVCKIQKLLPLTPDPADNVLWERKLVPAKNISQFVRWGKTGEAMFKDAIELINK